jgi:hypothetical protein
MVNLFKKFYLIIKRKDTLKLPNGNELYYTRTGFGITVTPENKVKALRSFAIRDQMSRDPNFAIKHPKLAAIINQE